MYQINTHTQKSMLCHPHVDTHMLFMFFPFRDENELKYSNSNNENLSFPNVLETVNLNRKIEPYAVLVEDALERLATNQESNIDQFGQQENEEVSERLNEDFKDLNMISRS